MTFEGLFAALTVCWFVLMCAIYYMDGDDEEPKRRGESDANYRG
jgi:hypothetical protein